ncbi:hypothetical protein GGQ02_002934 [Salinibacter ruber]|uniref:Uncharacterized protein n=1 Tax=Salinibacter ruber TaxID=146919 RepID=A0A9X2ZWR3_9BACT|nr:hypothetical protein [Salinibacter ruber]MCS3711287.1 hypothetical protein [Salinibacter ruber]MCS4034527.1 hypothetical protein [Salinibacter ruber]
MGMVLDLLRGQCLSVREIAIHVAWSLWLKEVQKVNFHKTRDGRLDFYNQLVL